VSAPSRIALTLGDPRGIGPEVMERAARLYRDDGGPADLLLLGPSGAASPPEVGAYEGVLEWDGSEPGAGRVAAAAIRRAADLSLDGACDAVVTGPIHKPALRAAGLPFPGHTEMLQSLAGAPRVGMLMAAERTEVGGPLRVLLATTHLALREVVSRVTSELLVAQSRLLRDALVTGWAIDRPRIALCALNPHASDGGLFGDEESRIFRPAIEHLAAEGLLVDGPLPADTVFRRALQGHFDAVVAPYHDVGMAAFKTASFGAGVNVTLGLPFVRTSPDHGTAFDIAGEGRADPSSALEAVRLAARLAQRRAAREGASTL